MCYIIVLVNISIYLDTEDISESSIFYRTGYTRICEQRKFVLKFWINAHTRIRGRMQSIVTTFRVSCPPHKRNRIIVQATDHTPGVDLCYRGRRRVYRNSLPANGREHAKHRHRYGHRFLQSSPWRNCLHLSVQFPRDDTSLVVSGLGRLWKRHDSQTVRACTGSFDDPG